MGHGIDPRSAPRSSGRRRASTGSHTLPSKVEGRIAAHAQKAYGGGSPRPEGRVALEGGVRLEETARGIGQAGSL